MRFGTDFGRFWAPRPPPKVEVGMGRIWVQNRACFASYFFVVWDRLQDCPRGPQEAPRPPQKRPKRLQEAPKSAPGGSNRTSRDPKSRSRGLYNSKDALLRCPATECKTGIPKNGGRAAVMPLGARPSGYVDFANLERLRCLLEPLGAILEGLEPS